VSCVCLVCVPRVLCLSCLCSSCLVFVLFVFLVYCVCLVVSGITAGTLIVKILESQIICIRMWEQVNHRVQIG
jgi:hypothetical protein